MVMILSFVLGGFILAIAMERWNLHTRVALTIINLIGASTSKILLDSWWQQDSYLCLYRTLQL